MSTADNPNQPSGTGSIGIQVAPTSVLPEIPAQVRYLKEEKDGHIGQEGDQDPSATDLQNLRRVPDKIPWAVFTIGVIELCERFSYNGTQTLCEWHNPGESLHI